MRRLIHAAAVALVIVGLSACSILDPGDRQELRDRIGAMPPEDVTLLRRVFMNVKAINWLDLKPKNDQMGKLQCRYMAGGKWGEWQYQEEVHTVADMLDCLKYEQIAATYMVCMEKWVADKLISKREQIMNMDPVPGGADVECRYEWDFRYEPEKVPQGMIKLESISIDDIIDFLIASPAPPPGWVMAPELIPLLCPLDVGPGWGCPDSPATEGDPPPNGGG